jgi:rare lipoprotein A
MVTGSIALAACAGPPAPRLGAEEGSAPRADSGNTAASSSFRQEGLASWYSDRLQGRPTASGAPYDRSALTAAHRTLPFGTVVRVLRRDTDRSVIVTINDRGPFVEGRIVDLSRRAAEQLAMIDAGVVPVRLEVVD